MYNKRIKITAQCCNWETQLFQIANQTSLQKNIQQTMPQGSGQSPTINEVLRFPHNTIMGSQLILGDSVPREKSGQ
jgi:hypothetical protein